MVADAKFALIWLRIYHPKMNLEKVMEGVLLNSSKRKINLDRHNAAVSPIAEKMIDKVLEIDSSFFKEYRYDDSRNRCLLRGKYRYVDIVTPVYC
jgi:gluconate kinase